MADVRCPFVVVLRYAEGNDHYQLENLNAHNEASPWKNMENSRELEQQVA